MSEVCDLEVTEGLISLNLILLGQYQSKGSCEARLADKTFMHAESLPICVHREFGMLSASLQLSQGCIETVRPAPAIVALLPGYTDHHDLRRLKDFSDLT